MSLINKVLRDLDARGSDRDTRSPLRGTRLYTPQSRRSPVRLAVLAVVVVAGAYAAVSHWVQPLPGWPGGNATWTTAKPLPVSAADHATPVPARAAPPAATVSSPATPAARPAPAAKPVARPKPVVKKAPRTVAKPAPASSDGRLRITAKTLSASERAGNAFHEGAEAVQQGRRELAERKLRESLALDARHNQARELLVGVLLGGGRRAEAIRVLEQGVATTPGAANLHILLARVYVDEGRSNESIVLLEKATARAGADAELTGFLATLYQRGGRHADAVVAHRKALEARPDEGRWWAGLGISLEATGDNAGATAAYQRALGARIDARLAGYARQRLAALGTAGR